MDFLAQQQGHVLAAGKGHPPDAMSQQTNPMNAMKTLRRNDSLGIGEHTRVSRALAGVPPVSGFRKAAQPMIKRKRPRSHRRDADGSERDGRAPLFLLNRLMCLNDMRQLTLAWIQRLEG